jgi:hypothetical protein
MKILITESQDKYIEDIQKRMLFRLWDKQGYASFDALQSKLFGLSWNGYITISKWVSEWNEEHGIDPLDYLRKDFKLVQTAPNKYVLDTSERHKEIFINRGNVTFKLILYMIEVYTDDRVMEFSFGWDIGSYKENGVGIFHDINPNELDDDEYYGMINEYRDTILVNTNHYLLEKYSNKMGYDFESYID